MIGLFIGSFNPFTLAHLEICLKLKNDFKKIVLIPVNSKDKDLIDLSFRIKMLEIIKEKYPFLVLDDIMKDYSYLNYSIIDKLNEKYQNIKIIIGSDLLDKIDSFDNYNYLLDKYSFVVIERENYDAKRIIQNKYFNYQDKFLIISFNNNISSTKVRKLLKNNQDTIKFLDQDILDYIKKHHLY